VGYTDRVVRAFRWEDLSENSDHVSGQLLLLKKWLLEGQVRKRGVQSRMSYSRQEVALPREEEQNIDPMHKPIVVLMA